MEHLTGTRILSHERPSKTYGLNRVCLAPDCNVKLSRYNSGKYCYSHEPKKEPRTRGRKVA